jgi:hypothetical protein
VIFGTIFLAIVVFTIILAVKNPNGIKGVWENIKAIFVNK